MGLFDHLYHLDWTARYPLQYYYNDGRLVVFDKYEIDMFGGIYNKKTRRRLSYYKNGEYDMTGLYDSMGNKCGIIVARSVVSTFCGKPPTIEHSTEHIDCNNKDNDIVCELTWMEPSGQNKNKFCPEDLLNAYIIVREDLEMTSKEWVKYLNEEKNSYGRAYTMSMIQHYAQEKRYGFSYKIYENLQGETWYKVIDSENKKGHWEISNQNRIAYISNHARNVIDSRRFGFTRKYPMININGKQRLLHNVAFETFYPAEYAAMKSNEMILHKYDDKLDFRPHVLYIGNASKNGKDAHVNGKYDGTKSSRMLCCSYVNDTFEKRYESQEDAVKYLREIGYFSASKGNISNAIKSNKSIKIYDRTWGVA